jgi:hypothetical protein
LAWKIGKKAETPSLTDRVHKVGSLNLSLSVLLHFPDLLWGGCTEFKNITLKCPRQEFENVWRDKLHNPLEWAGLFSYKKWGSLPKWNVLFSLQPIWNVSSREGIKLPGVAAVKKARPFIQKVFSKLCTKFRLHCQGL